MVEYEASVEVARPVADVFAFVVDFERMPRWAPGIVAAGLVEGSQLGPGARGYEVRRFFGRRVASTWELTAWEPPRGFTMAFASKSVRGEGRFRFEPLGEGAARVVVEVTAAVPGLLRRLFEREDGKILAALKRELERQPAAAR
jgi:carbon monoxide dehydrogenase subunit G